MLEMDCAQQHELRVLYAGGDLHNGAPDSWAEQDNIDPINHAKTLPHHKDLADHCLHSQPKPIMLLEF